MIKNSVEIFSRFWLYYIERNDKLNMATLKIKYECTGKNTEAVCEPCTDINHETFYIVDECPVCGEEHYITL